MNETCIDERPARVEADSRATSIMASTASSKHDSSDWNNEWSDSLDVSKQDRVSPHLSRSMNGLYH